MGDVVAEVNNFFKKHELRHKIQSLEPAWLRDFFEAVDANRVFIWGKGARQPTPYKGSVQRPSLSPLTAVKDVLGYFRKERLYTFRESDYVVCPELVKLARDYFFLDTYSSPKL